MKKLKFTKSLFITVSSYLFCIGCNQTINHTALLECNSDCDSLHKDYEDGKLKAIYAYKDGLRQGVFVFFENGDTVYGFHEYKDKYYKRTIKRSKGGGFVVDLYKLKDGEYVPSEAISYNASGKIKMEESHFLEVKHEDMIIIKPHLQGQYDSIHLYANNALITKASMTDGFIQIDIENIKEDLSLFVFEDMGINEKGEKEIQGFDFPLTTERLSKDFIDPANLKLPSKL
ncbi:MAG: hypothetical protein ACPF9D_02510 [Owenweeksia sp.]